MSAGTVDFSKIIPRMRDEIQKHVTRKAAQGRVLTEREAIISWLDKHYDTWLAEQLNLPPGKIDENQGLSHKGRGGRRISLEISAFYRVLWIPPERGEDGSKMDSDNAPAVAAEVKNISAGGLYIVTGRAFPISTLMEVEFELPAFPEPVTAFSMVVWREERKDGRFGHGLHFSHIETSQMDMLSEAIVERLLDAPVVTTDPDEIPSAASSSP